MPHEIRLASFNVRNLAMPGLVYYENAPAYSPAEYDMKTTWIAQQLDQSNADVIGLQEIFSPDALHDVLKKTRHYKDAQCITVEPATESLPKSPNVALISRLPLAAPPVFYAELPDGLSVPLPGDDNRMTHFSRPVLHARIRFPNQKETHLLVTHLKSKNPDVPENANPATPFIPEIGALRSLIRRGADALGLRHLVIRLRQTDNLPVIVMGDLNDFACATSTQILCGDMQNAEAFMQHHLYNSFELQPGISQEEKYSHFVPGTTIPRIDHILLSKEFTAQTRFRLGRVSGLRHFNSHLDKDRPEISDHGLLMVSLVLK